MSKAKETKKKKNSNILIYSFICILWCIIGVFIGLAIDSAEEVVGIYHTYKWNGNQEAAIVLYEDQTCSFPSVDPLYEQKTCVWNQKDKKIKLDITEQTADYIEGHYLYKEIEKEAELTIVDDGFLYESTLFEKID